MKKTWFIIVSLLFLVEVAKAQYNPTLIKYVFNTLVYNPAYAGTNGHLSLGFNYGQKLMGIDGGPNAQALTIHTPLKKKRSAIGLSLLSSSVGVSQSRSINFNYAYHIPVAAGTLSMGLQGTVMNYRLDPTRAGSLITSLSNTEQQFKSNMGIGFYYVSEYLYAGVSIPSLKEYNFEWSGTHRYYFSTIGGNIPIKKNQLILRPALVLKNVGWWSELRKNTLYKRISTLNELDIDLSILCFNKLGLGAVVRPSFGIFNTKKNAFETTGIWATYKMKNGLNLGISYDFPVPSFADVSAGGFQAKVAYEFRNKIDENIILKYIKFRGLRFEY